MHRRMKAGTGEADVAARERIRTLQSQLEVAERYTGISSTKAMLTVETKAGGHATG